MPLVEATMTVPLGTPWTVLSCVGLVNALYTHLPNYDGSKWGRVLGLRRKPWHERKSGDLILWEQHEGLVIPRHVGVILNASEQFILHSGYSGRAHPAWQREAFVRVFQLQRVVDRATVLHIP
jgi:hypothetical protein